MLPRTAKGTPCTRVTARNLGAAVCRTSNKIILTTGLNYARGTNNNICPARIPAINIEGVPGSRPPPPSLLSLSPLTIQEPSRAYPLHGAPSAKWSLILGLRTRLDVEQRAPVRTERGPCEKGPDLVAVILRSRCQRSSLRLAEITWECNRPLHGRFNEIRVSSPKYRAIEIVSKAMMK